MTPSHTLVWVNLGTDKTVPDGVRYEFFEDEGAATVRRAAIDPSRSKSNLHTFCEADHLMWDAEQKQREAAKNGPPETKKKK